MSGRIEEVIEKCCGSIIYVDKHAKLQFVHLTAREFLMRKGYESEFTATKAEGHRRLAITCFEALTRSEKAAPRARRLRSGPDETTPELLPETRPKSLPEARREPRRDHVQSRSTPSSAWGFTPFVTQYVWLYLFQHLDYISIPDTEILERLVKFLESPSVLWWIEFQAKCGDLHTVLQASRTIKSLLQRHITNSTSLESLQARSRLRLLAKWANDLMFLVTKFGTRLRRSPQSIHHIIPAFAPADSAIHARFGNNALRGISVHGLSQSSWDDCLTTISFAKGSKPNALATGRGYFAIGMMDPKGIIIVYDDSVF